MTRELRCSYLPDGTFVPGCMGALYDREQCTCHTLEAEVERVQAELGRLRRQLQAAQEVPERLQRTVCRLRRELAQRSRRRGGLTPPDPSTWGP